MALVGRLIRMGTGGAPRSFDPRRAPRGISSRHAVCVAILAAALDLLAVTQTRAQQPYPSRPVTVIVPYAPGGNTDGIARLVAQRFGEKLGQQFVVENRAGASGAIGAEYVARAPADGYTLLMAALTQIAIVPAVSKTRYDPIKDFTPISAVGTNAFVLVVHKDVPVKSLADFVAYVRARPGQLSYASGGVGSQNHLSMAYFLKLAGLDMIHVGYKGNAPSMSDLVAGHVPAMLSNVSDALPQATAGAIRILAVTSERRAPQIPAAPTFAESGFPQFKSVTWNGLLAPAATPRTIVERLAKLTAEAVTDPQIAARLAGFGIDPLGNSPEEFADMIAADTVLWAEAARIAGIVTQ